MAICKNQCPCQMLHITKTYDHRNILAFYRAREAQCAQKSYEFQHHLIFLLMFKDETSGRWFYFGVDSNHIKNL